MDWTSLVMNHLCPALGCITSTLMFAAPVRDLQECVVNGELGSLNPIPWTIMAGNCFGWIIYAYYKQDPYILASNLPGFLLSLWLNVGAVKIQYLLEERKTEEHSSVRFVPQERLLSKVILVWAAISVWVGWIMPSTSCTYSPAEVVGILVNFNLVFFYAAPLQSISNVVRTKSSDSIHVQSVLMNIVNTTFWVIYGMAKKDLIIIIPNALGLLLGLAQASVCLVYPRRGENETGDDDVEVANEKATLLKRYQTQVTSRMSSLNA